MNGERGRASEGALRGERPLGFHQAWASFESCDVRKCQANPAAEVRGLAGSRGVQPRSSVLSISLRDLRVNSAGATQRGALTDVHTFSHIDTHTFA